jgi:hypothetical protein
MTKTELIDWLHKEGFHHTADYVRQDCFDHLKGFVNAVSHPLYKTNLINYLRLHKLSQILDR